LGGAGMLVMRRVFTLRVRVRGCMLPPLLGVRGACRYAIDATMKWSDRMLGGDVSAPADLCGKAVLSGG
jgi:hypothetical protein